MISYLTDIVLMIALVVTSWRTGMMYRELRRLRGGEQGLGEALHAADQSINRAAHAVVVLKNEGVRTLQGLESQCENARDLADRLEALVARADRHCATRRDVAASKASSLTVFERQAGGLPVSHQPRALPQTGRLPQGA